VSAGEELDELLRAVSEQYTTDPSGPGVHLAIVRSRGEYYASVKRFQEAYGKGDFVVCKATARSLDGVIHRVCKEWLAKGGVHQRLADAVLRTEQEVVAAKGVPSGGLGS
jgi:O-acetyl-ADP-ribose deacetylase (regulator of RNase III)